MGNLESRIEKWSTGLERTVEAYLRGITEGKAALAGIKECADARAVAESIYANVDKEANFCYGNTCFWKPYAFLGKYYLLFVEGRYLEVDFKAYADNRLVEWVLPLVSGDFQPLGDVPPYRRVSNAGPSLGEARKYFFEQCGIPTGFLAKSVLRECRSLHELKRRLFRSRWHSGDTFRFGNLAFMNVAMHDSEWCLFQDGSRVGKFDFKPFIEIERQDDFLDILLRAFLSGYGFAAMEIGQYRDWKFGLSTRTVYRISESRYEINDTSSGWRQAQTGLKELLKIACGDKGLESLDWY